MIKKSILLKGNSSMRWVNTAASSAWLGEATGWQGMPSTHTCHTRSTACPAVLPSHILSFFICTVLLRKQRIRVWLFSPAVELEKTHICPLQTVAASSAFFKLMEWENAGSRDLRNLPIRPI